MKVLTHPEQFTNGVRILMRVLRTKDGGVGNVDRHAKKLVSRNPKEFEECLARLVDDMLPTERIYSTVDMRDMSKAIRTFKTEQLSNDYNPEHVRDDFYIDVYNRWISALQQPSARATSLFLWDCDTPEQYADVQQVLYAVGAAIVHRYDTKNGGHIITAPFNYTILDRNDYQPLCKKNAMMLWVYQDNK